ncbi:MAG TPA: FliG C-terminal domain-containing protein [Myxococcota bacterium]
MADPVNPAALAAANANAAALMSSSSPSAPTGVDGATQAASLLLSLGHEAAAEVLKSLPPSKVAAIAKAAKSLRAVDDSVQAQAIARFNHTMAYFDSTSTTRTRAFEQMLTAAIGKDAAQRAFKEELPITDELGMQPIVDADDADIALLLEHESPEVIALVMSVLTPEKARAVLSHLPVALQAPTLFALANFQAIDAAYVADVISGLAQQVRELVTGPRRRPLTGEKNALEILRKFKADERRSLLEELERTAPELSGRMKSRLFAFDDLAKLPRKAIQQILQACDARVLALALKGAPPSVTDAVVANMSQRSAAALREEIELLGRVKLAQIEKAQLDVVAVITGLAEQGTIDIEIEEEG